jgi:HTH-type transcriptional regulator / antitoxin HipB
MLASWLINASLSTQAQLQTLLRAMRSARGLSQAALGLKVDVSQRRIAAIEAAPGRASFDQLFKIITLLGGRLSISDSEASAVKPAAKKTPTRNAARSETADW